MFLTFASRHMLADKLGFPIRAPGGDWLPQNCRKTRLFRITRYVIYFHPAIARGRENRLLMDFDREAGLLSHPVATSTMIYNHYS
jgi:hypothetical protein